MRKLQCIHINLLRAKAGSGLSNEKTVYKYGVRLSLHSVIFNQVGRFKSSPFP